MDAEKTSKPSIGIDLGTTCVAVFQRGRVDVIANGQGSRITPSVVAFTETGRIVGEGAEVQKTLDPENTICSAKRFIGRMPDDPAEETNQRYGLVHSALPWVSPTLFWTPLPPPSLPAPWMPAARCKWVMPGLRAATGRDGQ